MKRIRLALCSLVVIALLAFWLWPDCRTIETEGEIMLRPEETDTGSMVATIPAKSRVRICDVLLVTGRGVSAHDRLTYGSPGEMFPRPVAMVEVRADVGDMTGVHGWIRMTAFSESDASKILKKYRPWAK